MVKEKDSKKEHDGKVDHTHSTNKSHSHESHKEHSHKTKSNINPWIISTIVLAVLLIFFLIPSPESNVDNSAQVGQKFVEFLNAKGTQVDYVSAKDFGDDLYEVIVQVDGREVPAHVTKDGKYFVQVIFELDEEQEEVVVKEEPKVVKSDKPTVELFIWSYCPYGVQAQGPLAEVVELLGDSADFEAVMYHDGHGPYETQQNKIQSCIQELDKGKYWNYASKFVSDIYPVCGPSRDIVCDKDESIKLMKSLGINDLAIMDCVNTRGEELLASQVSRAQAYGVTGSPSIVINGAKVQPSSRTADAFKSTICSSYNSAPEECGQVLDTTSASAAGNC